MIFLWSTSNRVGSRLIRWGRETDCSHFAIAWDGIGKDIPQSHWLITESRLSTGVKADWLSVFKKHNKIVHSLRVRVDQKTERDYYCKYIREMGGRQYDTSAIAFFGMLSLAEKIGFKEVAKNPWNSGQRVFCTETAKLFDPLFKENGIDLGQYSLLDPHELYVKLVLQDLFKVVPLRDLS